MKILLGTDLLVCLVCNRRYMDGLTVLFQWIAAIHAERCVDIASLAVATNFDAPNNWSNIPNFTIIKKVSRGANRVKQAKKLRSVENSLDGALFAQLALIEEHDVDFLITENQSLLHYAKQLELDDRLYTIEEFIEKCAAECRDIDPFKGCVVCRDTFDHLSIRDPFFSTFIEEYAPKYFDWFSRKQAHKDDIYVVRDKKNCVHALLKLKEEDEDEDYSNISPSMHPARRLKISSFKVEYTGQKLGERFMRIVFEQAIAKKVDEIYITIFNTSTTRQRLIDLISRWGFTFWGYKDKEELVYVRPFRPCFTGNLQDSFPYHTLCAGAFIVPIHKTYSDELLPPYSFREKETDIEPFKCAIRKTLVLHADHSDLKYGSILLFYQKTSETNNRRIIAVGVVENVYRNIKNKSQFLMRCRKRSILSDKQLSECWNLDGNESIIVDFLYVYSFLQTDCLCVDKLAEISIPSDELVQKYLWPLSENQFLNLIHNTSYEKSAFLYPNSVRG